MNAELLGIITVGIVLLGVGAAFIAQSDDIQTILQIEGHIDQSHQLLQELTHIIVIQVLYLNVGRAGPWG